MGIFDKLKETKEEDVIVLGRRSDHSPYPADWSDQASVFPVVSSTASFCSGAEGRINVRAFLSVDNANRGGIVLQITGRSDCGFIPGARILPNGIAIHLAGDAESAALVEALLAALEKVQSRQVSSTTDVSISYCQTYDLKALQKR